RTTWVVAFRREYMATWSDFVLDLPDADRQRLETLSLKRFPRDVAERVIAVLVEESRLPIDQKVVAEVVASVAEDGKVSPVDIGISLLALSEVTPGVRTYSIDRFRSTGGQTGLLVSYLERLLEGWGEKERSEVLRALLELVVLDDDRRMAEGGTLDELVDAVDPVQPERFRKRLDYLASPRARILERVPATAESGPLRLTHERLIPALRRLTGMLLAEPEQARLEMERLYVIWSRDRQRKYLLSGGPLRRTLRHQAQFRGLERDTDKQEFIWRSRRRRSLLRGAAVVGLVVLGIGGTSVASWVQVELHRTALESWNLPRDLYDYQKQLEELILPGAVHHLGWLKPGIKTLDLTATGITSLEGLPDSITSLDLSNNGITSLEGLPDSITSLDLRRTRITSLEGLPDSITSLDLRHTRITSLEGLPDSITSLGLS
ncbi:MAG: hypothetical protein GY856_28320, partial [bacterium]|nr:hypothetical protein [bacterium]